MQIKFIYRIVSFFLICLIFDSIIGKTLHFCYNKTKDPTISKIKYTLDSTNQTILIYGSSRALHHYNSSILIDSLNCTVYNCGFEGQGLDFSYIQISSMFNKFNPKAIIIDISANILLDADSKNKLMVLFPLAYKNPIIKNQIVGDKIIEKIKFTSTIYPYNSQVVNIIKGFFYRKLDTSYGYIPLLGTLDTIGLIENVKICYPNYISIAKNIQIIKEINKLCKAHNCKLFTVISPVFFSNINLKNINNDIVKYIENLDSIKVIDFTNDVTFTKNETLFKDNLHLNSLGANLFSSIFAKKIKADIKKYGESKNIIND